MSKIKNTAKKIGITLALPVAVYLVFTVITHLVPGAIPFGSFSLLVNVLQNSVLGILVALALCVNMPTGRMDFSAGAVVVLTSIICARVAIQYELPILVMLIMCILFATIMEIITGAVYIALRLPSMIVTLGLCIIYESITGIVYEGQGVTALVDSVRLLGYAPYCFILLLAAMFLFHIVTEHTVFAYHSRLLTGSQFMAVKVGVNEKKNTILSFALSGVFLGAAATVYVSNYGLVEASSNMSSVSVMFNSMLPVMIGLTLSNYSCRVIGVSVAVFSMRMVSYGLFCLGYNASIQNVVSGIFIVIMVITTDFLSAKPERDRIIMRKIKIMEESGA